MTKLVKVLMRRKTMVRFNHNTYRTVILKLLKHSNSIAIVMILIAMYVCFSPNMWLYIAILGLSSLYLGWLTCQYVIAESSECKEGCNLQYGCQIASFNSRLSIVSNITISLFGLGITILLARYSLNQGTIESDAVATINTHYISGFFKMMLMYVLSDKIHTSQLLMSILYRYSQVVKYLNINIDQDKAWKRYPEIYLDGARIADERYRVTGYEKSVTVVFTPTLSLGDKSIIEYNMIEEDDDHVVHGEGIYDKYDKQTCLFRCHVVVKNKDKSEVQQTS